MTYDLSSSEEEAFDRLVKRLLAKEWERFPAPSARVWRALSVRLGSQVNSGRLIGPEPTVDAHAGFCSDHRCMYQETELLPAPNVKRLIT